MNVFTLASNDQSLFFLGQVFGLVGTVLPIDGTGPVILGVMFKAFNSVVLSVGALIVVYITVMGVMATAAEGEFLGKKWHSLWVPIRTLIGIAALVPTTSGYSAIQIVVMWVIVQGIGAADFVWTTTINTLQNIGSPYAGVNIPSVGVQNSLQTLFKAVTCDVAARSTYDNPMLPFPLPLPMPGGYYCATTSGSYCQGGNPFNPNSALPIYMLGPGGKCGIMMYCNKMAMCNTPEGANSIACISCTKQQEALQATVDQFRSIATKFVQYDYEYRLFFLRSGTGEYAAPSWIQNYCNSKGHSDPTTCCVQYTGGGGKCTNNSGDFPAIGPDFANPSQDVVNFIWQNALGPDLKFASFVQINTKNYVKSIVDAVTTRIQDMAIQSPTTLPAQLQQARDYGWIYAGAYYYYIAQMNNNNLASAIPFLNFLEVDPSAPDSSSPNPLTILRNDYKAAGQLLSAASASASSSGTTPPPPPMLGPMTDSLNSAAGGIMDSWMNTVTGAGPGQLAQNPIAKLQAFGQGILIAIQIVFVVVLVGTIITAILGYLSVYVLGTGVTNPVGGAITTIYLVIVPVLMAFLGAFFTFGGMLAIYLPLIPYIIFTAGAIGWFIATIEAMVAAPLVALGILAPGGHHEMFGKAEPALMLIFGIFLRPALMIFGMITGMLLATVVVTMINTGFKVVMSSISTSPGIIELILFMAAYVTLVISSVNKCFALIHMVPDRVLRWIGGTVESYGEAEMLGEVKGGISGAAAGASGAAAGAAAMPKQMGDAARERKGAHMKEEQQKKQTSAGPTVEGGGGKK